ncbi:MAG: hypothetical protein RIR51_470 [Bacteroidota bacterium]
MNYQTRFHTVRNKFFILIFALVQTFSVVGQISTPTTLVVDQADLLNPEQEARLERKLVDYDDSTSTQIAVALVKSLEGKDSFDYAMELAKEWGVGQEGKNNGVVILVSMGDRQIRIVTGRGVEAELPDAICKRIINNKITPNFRNGAYYQGLDEATTEMIDRLEGRFVNNEEKESGGGFKPLIFYILIILIITFINARRNRGGKGGRGGNGSAGGGMFFPPIFFGGGHHHSGGGYGGGGGFGGGGFGGFGGGSFGGGGAGGSW